MNISPSSINNFLRCRVMWHYANQRRLAPIESRPALFLGSAVHHALEHWYTDLPTPDPVSLLMAWGKAEMLRLRVAGAPLDVVKYSELLDLGASMLGGYLRTYGATPAEDKDGLTVLKTEKEFRVAIPGTDGHLIGRVDALCRDAYGGVWVFETKTYSQAPTRHDFNLQTLAYVWALNQPDAASVLESVGVPPNTPVLGSYYNGLRKQAWSERVKNPLFLRIQMERTAEELAIFGTMLADIHRDMSGSPSIYPTFTSECGWCDYKEPCAGRMQGDGEEWHLDTFFTQKVYTK